MGANLRDTERDELVAALHQISTFGEALQQLNERLLDALASGASRPDAEEIDDMRAGPPTAA